jgi:hypothetical protein
MSGLRACDSWRPSANSVTMSTPLEEVQCVLWLAELQSLTAVQRRFRMQYGRQPPTRKSIRFWDRTTSRLLRIKFRGKIRTSDENVKRISEAFSEVRANQFVLLACSYKFYVQQLMMCYTKAQPKNVQYSNDSCTKIE